MASGSGKDLHGAVEEERLRSHSKIKSYFGGQRRLQGLIDFPSFQQGNFGIKNTINRLKGDVTKVEFGSKMAKEIKKEDLHRAVEENYGTLVLDLLSRGFDVNAKDKDGRTALFIAAKKGQADKVSILIRHGAEVNTKCNTGETPLYGACEDGHEHVVRKLLEHKADVNMPNDLGETPLHAAAWKQSQSLITLLIASGAQVNKPNIYGDTPLHQACECGHEHVVQELLKHNANINMPNDRGETPLYAAVWNESQSLITLLIDSGAHVNTPDIYGHAPLHLACELGSDNVVQELIKLKGDVNIRNKKDKTPLHIAMEKKSNSIAKLLIASGANIKTMDRYNNTPLHFACKSGDKNMVQKLLELKADVNMQNIIGETPLNVALEGKHNSIAQMLVDSGAETNLADKNGETLLHRAVYRREKEEVLVLLQLGANVDTSNKKGETALDIAVKLQDTEMEAILKNGKEKTTRDQSFKRNHEDATALLSQLKTHRGFEELDLPRNSAIYAEIKSRISSLQELLSQETKYRQVILKTLLVEASRIICIIFGIRLEKLKKEKGPIWEDLEELLDRGHTETEVEDLEQKLKLLESNVIKARDVNTKFLPEMDQIMEDLQTCFAEMKRVTPRVENFKNVKELDRLIKMINFKVLKNIYINKRLRNKLKKKRNYINFQCEKFGKFEETLQDKINSVEKLQKELDSINMEVNPQDHGSLINDFDGQEKRTELFQTTLSELERRLQQITGSLYQSSFPAHEEIEKFNSEIITLKSDILDCIGLLPIFKPRSNPKQMTGYNSKLIEFGQFQNRLNDITRDLAYEDDGIEKCEVKLKELKDDLLKSIIIPPVVIRAYPLIPHSEINRGEDYDAQSVKNGKKCDEDKKTENGRNGFENMNAKNGYNDDENKNIKRDDQEGEDGSGVENATKGEDDDENKNTNHGNIDDENKNTTREDKKHGKKREAQEEDEGEGPSMKRSKKEDESLNEELLMNAREGNADQVETLIENGANPNVMDENGKTPLMLAAIKGFKTVVEELLRLRKEGKTNINKTDREGNTALHYSVLNNQIDIVLILVKNKACLNHENDDGKTARVIAKQRGYKKILDILNIPKKISEVQHLIQNFGGVINIYQSSPTTTIANTLVKSENNNLGEGSGPQSFK